MNIEEEINWILVDGGNGLDVLWFLLLHSPFIQGLVSPRPPYRRPMRIF